jgi:hypothetical protein
VVAESVRRVNTERQVLAKFAAKAANSSVWLEKSSGKMAFWPGTKHAFQCQFQPNLGVAHACRFVHDLPSRGFFLDFNNIQAKK